MVNKPLILPNFWWHSNQLVGAGPVVFQLKKVLHRKLGGGFKYFLFSPLLGEMIPID